MANKPRKSHKPSKNRKNPPDTEQSNPMPPTGDDHHGGNIDEAPESGTVRRAYNSGQQPENRGQNLGND